MWKNLVCLSALAIVLLGLLSAVFMLQEVEASETVYIRATGEVEGTDKIERLGDMYVFTDNISDCITVERDNIVVDGGGFTLEGLVSTYFAGIYLRGRYNVTIRNLTIRRFRYGVIVSSSSNISVIASNIAVGQTTGYHTGAYLLNSSRNVVLGNRFSNNTRGIFLASSSENNISRNHIADNENGIWLENSSNNTLSENNITSNGYDGIFLYDSSNNSMYGNTIAKHTSKFGNCNGISLSVSSDDNISSGNNITDNDCGIRLDSSNHNTISGNKIADNREGVHVEYSYHNKFHHNSFIENNQQVNMTTSGYVNLWDDGKRGNYWSDYEERYPNATEVDGSEIWDTPYVVDEDNQDNYPIVPEFSTRNILSLFMMLTLLATVAYGMKYALRKGNL